MVTWTVPAVFPCSTSAEVTQRHQTLHRRQRSHRQRPNYGDVGAASVRSAALRVGCDPAAIWCAAARRAASDGSSGSIWSSRSRCQAAAVPSRQFQAMGLATMPREPRTPRRPAGPRGPTGGGDPRPPTTPRRPGGPRRRSGRSAGRRGPARAGPARPKGGRRGVGTDPGRPVHPGSQESAAVGPKGHRTDPGAIAVPQGRRERLAGLGVPDPRSRPGCTWPAADRPG